MDRNTQACRLYDFALSVTSLVVGLLAIVYAVYSTSAFSQSSASLISASQDISRNSSALTQVTDELAQKIESVPYHLIEEMSKKIGDTQIMLKTFTDKALTQPEGSTTPLARVPDSFIHQSSAVGVLALYACYLSFSRKKPLDLENIVKGFPPEINPGEAWYWYGYIIASQAIGILSTQVVGLVFTVNKFEPSVGTQLVPSLDAVETVYKDKPLNEAIQQKRKVVENYFSNH